VYFLPPYFIAVSGASDGIGKEFALQLAKKGFNILLIGRNQEKLEQVEIEISKM
jgi:short-subunit dehydrogenase